MKLSESLAGVVIPVVCIALGSAAAVTVVGSSSPEHALLSSPSCSISRTERRTAEDGESELCGVFESDRRSSDVRSSLCTKRFRTNPKLKDGLEAVFCVVVSLSAV